MKMNKLTKEGHTNKKVVIEFAVQTVAANVELYQLAHLSRRDALHASASASASFTTQYKLV